MPKESIPLVVTSPPFDNIFRYGGHPWDFEIFKMVANQLARILMPGGRICWMIKDQRKGGLTGTSFRQCLYFQNHLGLRYADRLFIEFDNIKQRRYGYGETIQEVFVFSKGNPNRGRLLDDRPNSTAGARQRFNYRNHDGSTRTWVSETGVVSHRGLRTHQWKYALRNKPPEVGDFCAAMPLELARDLVKSYSNVGDLVLDPFSGSGTTAVAALFEYRRYLGFEIWDKAYRISSKRLKKAHQEYQRRLDQMLLVRSDSEPS